MDLTQENKIPQVFKAISEVSKGIGFISKSQKNTMQNYNFRGIDDIYNNINPELHKHGLIIIPNILSRECVEYIGVKGNKQFHVVLKVEFSFISCVDGSSYKAVSYGEALDSSDKATNKAMSQAYKYMIIQVFAIPVKENEDADSLSPDIGDKVVSVDNFEDMEVKLISDVQVKELENLIKETNTDKARLLKFAKINELSLLPEVKFESIKAMLLKKIGG